jgi:class 3 adenylate cyclase
MRTAILVLIGAFAIGITITAKQTAPKAAPTPMPVTAGQASRMTAMHDDGRKLDELTQQLNAATGNDRIDRLVAVVNELVAERRRMREGMAMHGGMMQPAAAPDTDHSSHHQEQK